MGNLSLPSIQFPFLLFHFHHVYINFTTPHHLYQFYLSFSTTIIIHIIWENNSTSVVSFFVYYIQLVYMLICFYPSHSFRNSVFLLFQLPHNDASQSRKSLCNALFKGEGRVEGNSNAPSSLQMSEGVMLELER